MHPDKVLSTEKGLAFVTAVCKCHPNLDCLDLAECPRITEDALFHLAQHCPNLTTINLHGNDKITDKHLEKLTQGCPKLSNINLSSTYFITDGGLLYVAQY